MVEAKSCLGYLCLNNVIYYMHSTTITVEMFFQVAISEGFCFQVWCKKRNYTITFQPFPCVLILPCWYIELKSWKFENIALKSPSHLHFRVPESVKYKYTLL